MAEGIETVMIVADTYVGGVPFFKGEGVAVTRLEARELIQSGKAVPGGTQTKEPAHAKPKKSAQYKKA